MTSLRIEIDREKCMGSGNCSIWASRTFDLDDDGIAFVVDAGGDPDDKIRTAAQRCPTHAIAVWRGDEQVV